MKTISQLTNKDCIHCETEEEANSICKLLHKAGKKWNNGESYLKYNWLYICSRTRNAWNCWTMSQDDLTEASYDDELLFDNIFISLQKVLTTLNFSWYNPSYWYLQWWIHEINERTNDNETTFKIWDYVCDRKLLNDNWTDATLRDQSEETQDIIYNMLCK